MKKRTISKPTRGAARLSDTEALPALDIHARVGYEGSISKCGDNADYDWCLYQDEKGEYVLFETDGAGCLYNFTQHRYPTSEEPTFRFYFDGNDFPSLTLKQSDFFKLNKSGGVFVGPEDEGRGPIWVVRNFAPMEFRTHCKVTSSIMLKGFDKNCGDGGWGHIIYVLYDKPDGLTTYSGDGNCPDRSVDKNLDRPGTDPKKTGGSEKWDSMGFSLGAGCSLSVFKTERGGSVSSVKLSLKSGFGDTVLTDLWIKIYFDNHETPDVNSPIGTFFGNEYALRACENKMLMLGMSLVPNEKMDAYNFFPMPFAKSAEVVLYNAGKEPVNVKKTGIVFTPDTVREYDMDKCAYFRSSAYYPRTANTAGKNSLIADIKGTGHMVYGVLSGEAIKFGCEGDVRVFFDGKQTPEIESDGSESWSSYGWGFVCPPQCNPFSGYNGLYNSNSAWSMVRLTAGDSYYFRSELRFELEHGCQNDGMGFHSGQIFYYGKDEPSVAISDELTVGDSRSEKAHSYSVCGKFSTASEKSRFANGLVSEESVRNVRIIGDGKISFTMKVAENNVGAVLRRTFSQQEGPQSAQVYIDGVKLDREWLYDDSNPVCKWAQDDILIPFTLLAGKEKIGITIVPRSVSDKECVWTECGYTLYAIIG